MARLLVFRGDMLDREIEIARLPFTIGRGSTNDLVLEDPVKSVSREHAEIRLDGARYVLVDRQSENGIWVAGKRCPTIAFEPETIATIGPFRLSVEGAPTVPAVEPTVMRSAAAEGMLPAVPKNATPPPQLRPSSPPAAAARTRRQLTQQQVMMIGGAAALVAIVALIVSVVMIRSNRRRDADARQMAAWIAQANVQLVQGACAEALSQNIQPGLARQPDNPDLLSLRQRADTCLRPSDPPPPPPDPITLALAEAREMIGRGECAAALSDRINGVLELNPENADALQLKEEAGKCAPQTVVRTNSGPKPPALAKRVPPEEGGLEPQATELDVDYQNRIKTMRARYDEAVGTASRGPSLAAVRAWEGIARDTPPRYLDVASKLTEATRAYRATAQPMLAEARDLGVREQWDEAIAKFRQAQQVDSSLSVEADVARIRDAKVAAGKAACTSAKQKISFFPAEGRTLYRKVIELLPPEDPCYAEAKRILGER